MNIFMEADSQQFNQYFDSKTVSQLEEHIQAYFFNEEEELNDALSKMGIDNVDHLVQMLATFFELNFDTASMDSISFDEFDLHKLSILFFKQSKLTFPLSMNPEESEKFQTIISKLGRVFIHSVIFPEIVNTNPHLAYSIKNMLERFIKKACLIDGYDSHAVLERLGFDTLVVPIPQQLNVSAKGGLQKYRQVKAEYLELKNVTEASITKLAKSIKSDYQAISTITPFCNLFISKGEDFQPLELTEKKLRFVIHLIYRMAKPFERGFQPLIGMNKGKGFWRFLQQNIFIDGTTSKRPLRQISSDINTGRYQDHLKIKTQVRNLLTPIYNLQKIKK